MDMLLVQEFGENKQYRFKVMYDEYEGRLNDDLDGITFISNNRNYLSRGKFKDYGLLDEDTIRDFEFNGFTVIPVYAYIHGGISLSVKPFDCPWDSGLFGQLIFEQGEFGENDQGLSGFIKGWDDLLNGQVFQFIVEEVKTCKCCGKNDVDIVDSCCGFYGYETNKDMFEDMIDVMNMPKELKNEVLDKIRGE